MSNDVVTRYSAETDQASFKKAEAQLSASQKRVQQAEQADIAFSRASKDVALAGDVESNIRTLGGAIGAVGGESGRAAEGLIAVGAEFPAVVEAVGKLPIALKAFPATMTAAAASVVGFEIALGPLIAAGLAAAAAIAAVAFLVNESKSAREEEAEALERQSEAHKQYLDALSLTSESIEEQIKTSEDALEANRKQQEFERKIIEENRAVTFMDKLGDALGTAGQKADQATDRLKELEEEEDELTLETEGLTEALKSAEVAANDARVALLDQADQTADLRRFEQAALDATTEQNARRAQAITDEQSILREQIATLEASGDTSEEVQDKIAELNQELGNLNQQSGILSSSAVKAAEAQNEQAKATDEVTKASKASEAAAKAVAASDKKIGDLRQQIAAEGVRIANEASEARREEANRIAEFQADNLKKRAAIINDFNRAELAAIKAHDKDRKNLAADQNFKALFELEESEAAEKDARKEAFDQRQADLQDEIKEERKKLFAETRLKAKAGTDQRHNLTMQLHAEIRAKQAAARAIVELEIEKGKAVIDVNRKITDQIAILFQRLTGARGVTNNTTNAQSLTINGAPLPTGLIGGSQIQNIVLQTLQQVGVS